MKKSTISVLLTLLLPVSVAVTAAEPDKQYLLDQEKPQPQHEVKTEVHKLETISLKQGEKDKVVMDKEAEAYYQEAVVQEKKSTVLMDKEIKIFDLKAAQADKKALAAMDKEEHKVEQEAELVGKQADAAVIVEQESQSQDAKVKAAKKASELKQTLKQNQ